MSEPQILSMERVKQHRKIYERWGNQTLYSGNDMLFWVDQVERLQAECAAMREALLGVEGGGSNVSGEHCCPECGGLSTTEGVMHILACSINAALSSNAGAQWLERHKAMERLYKAVKVAEDIRSEVLPLLASDEEQATWVTEWECRLHPADDEVEAALEALEAMDHAQ